MENKKKRSKAYHLYLTGGEALLNENCTNRGVSKDYKNSLFEDGSSAHLDRVGHNDKIFPKYID